MKNLSIKTQFNLGAALILIFVCVGASWYQYRNLHDQALTFVNNKTEIYLYAASSIRSYVKDVLRPTLATSLPSDRFIIEAMSTSYISRQIMNNLKSEYPEFIYRRASNDPRNPSNRADQFESGMLTWFADHPEESQWAGMIKKDGRAYFARIMPIYAENQCLHCHGSPQDAPMELWQKYGEKRNYGFEVGKIVGADTVYIPMDSINLLIKEKTFQVFLIGFISLFSLFFLFALLFNRTVVKQLKKLLLNFKSIYSDEHIEKDFFSTQSNDEIYQIKHAFENVANDLRIAHEGLKESEAKYRSLFQASPDAVFVSDAEGLLTDLNHAGKLLFEIGSLNQYLNNSQFNRLFCDLAEGQNLFAEIKCRGAVNNIECKLVTETGKQLIGLLSANRLLNEDNQFKGIEGVIRDVTEEKKLSKHLAQTERLAAIGQLAAGVAHEINNPLGVILCYGNLIIKNEKSDPQIKSDTEVIHKHAHSCKTIVESLLNFARASDTMMKAGNINECLDEMLSVLQNQMKKQNISVNKQLDQEIEQIIFDDGKIKQVFMNLLLNSMQAMPDGGTLNLESNFDTEKGQVVIKISDTGCGIADDKLDKIFEPFFTTKERGQGTGLGLSVSYGIIQQHHGEIAVSSQPGRGTTFSVSLPVNQNYSSHETIQSVA